MSKRLEGKVAIITGGTSGIGKATAELFVKEGAKVMISGLASPSEDAGLELIDRFRNAAAYQKADVTKESEIKTLIDATISTFGRLDILFNNAGAPTFGGVEDVTRESFQYAMDLIVGSVAFSMKYAAPMMKKQRSGCIINNSSVGAIRHGLGDYLYGAAKAAVTHITRLAGIELGVYGIRVNSISPGGIVTPIFLGGADAASSLSEESQTNLLKKVENEIAAATPLRRSGYPEDVAYAALFLAGEGSYVNCHDLLVDAGMTSASPWRPNPQ